MMKMPCGGFYIDENTLEVDDNILKAKNGGGGGTGVTVIECNVSYDETTEKSTITNVRAVIDALDAVCDDVSLAGSYAVAIKGLDTWKGGEGVIHSGYCPCSVGLYYGKCDSIFGGMDPEGSFYVIFRKYSDGDSYTLCNGTYNFTRQDLNVDGSLTGDF